MGTKYDNDFYEWTREQAAKLRAGAVSELDMENLAEEIESMGKNDRRELLSRLRVLIAHLLKWQHQPDVRSTSWKSTIREQRSELQQLLETSPSLRNLVPVMIGKVYGEAVKFAMDETGLPVDAFPSVCPYEPTELLCEDFFPGPTQPERHTPIRLHR